MVVRAGITTDLMESGPSEANWFLARNAGEEESFLVFSINPF